jgi:excinuclease ABC subunit C
MSMDKTTAKKSKDRVLDVCRPAGKLRPPEKLARVTSSPGVYLMKDAEGNIIYVGKALNLKKRLSSYFKKGSSADIKVGILISRIFDFETIITGSEKEALILESNLIKKYLPRYNVILKDDKRYPSLRIDLNQPYPNLAVVRKTKKDGALYFGPFSSAKAVHQTLKVINKAFKLRKCKTREPKMRSRPCLNHQMDSCLAPCCLNVPTAEYHRIVKEIVLFLKGRTPELIREIKNQMICASDNLDFETASQLRDKMFSLEKTLEKQIVVTTDFKNRDAIAIAVKTPYVLITVLNIRNGYLLDTRNFAFYETLSTDMEMVGTFIKQYYEKSHFVPPEILVPTIPEDTVLLEEALGSIRGGRASILMPQRGEKIAILRMAQRNAENGLKDFIASVENRANLLARLQKRLKMKGSPDRIECFDNSNISGKEPVSGMVVFENGNPDKSQYRRYRIRTVSGQDDYATMAEILGRRYSKGEGSKPYPDLLMVDGGKGQLNIALSVLKRLDLAANFQLVGIAKKDPERGELEDKIYIPGRVNPINFGREGDLLLFLQRIRDEAHRFAISFHRKIRTKSALVSVLDAIPGVGKKRKQTLLRHFGTIKKIRAATVEEIGELPGMNRNAAESVKSALTE